MTMFSDKKIIQLNLYINCSDIISSLSSPSSSSSSPMALQPTFGHGLPTRGFKTTKYLRIEDVSPMPKPTVEGLGTLLKTCTTRVALPAAS
jgi:hypothetical protein